MDIESWLRGCGMERYAEAFVAAEITVDLLPELTEADLAGLGLPLGPRKALLRAIREGQGVPVVAAPAAIVPGAVERRQLTVMFVDLVGSTALSARLNPEEMAAVLRGYQNAVVGEMARFEGHVAKFMGDGVLGYFGWPVAHEDEAERAVRAGLAIVGDVERVLGGSLADMAWARRQPIVHRRLECRTTQPVPLLRSD